MAIDLNGTSRPRLWSATPEGAFCSPGGAFVAGEALNDFRAVGEILIRTGAVRPCLPWRSEAALAALAVDEHEMTPEILSAEELALARSFRHALLVWRFGPPDS